MSDYQALNGDEQQQEQASQQDKKPAKSPEQRLADLIEKQAASRRKLELRVHRDNVKSINKSLTALIGKSVDITDDANFNNVEAAKVLADLVQQHRG